MPNHFAFKITPESAIYVKFSPEGYRLVLEGKENIVEIAMDVEGLRRISREVREKVK